jgi:hypothetical protein
VVKVAEKPDDIDSYTEKYIAPKVLCIDNIDSSRKPNEKFIQFFDHILTTRRLCKTPTIITSKITLKTLADNFGSSIYEILSNPVYERISIMSHDDQKVDIDFLNTGHTFVLSDIINEFKKLKIKQNKKSMPDCVDADEIQEILSRSIME